MLFKVVIICTAGVGCAPTRLEPQFNVESEEELREKKLPEWLKSVGYTQVEGTDIEVSEVKPDSEPEPEPVKGEAPTSAEPTGPTAPDGTKLEVWDLPEPTSDQAPPSKDGETSAQS